MKFRARWIWLLACFAVALFCVAYPIYVIWPFRRQDPAELRFALDVLRFRTPVMIAAVALGSIVAGLCWSAERSRGKRALAVTAATLTLGFAVLSQVNIYELMFHPVDRPEFVAANATKLDGTEMVLAIRIGDEARAYPIRSISYHHVVNDRLDGVPIVATY